MYGIVLCVRKRMFGLPEIWADWLQQNGSELDFTKIIFCTGTWSRDKAQKNTIWDPQESIRGYTVPRFSYTDNVHANTHHNLG